MDSDKCQESRKGGKEILCGVQREVDILDRVAREGKDLKERFVQVSGRRVFQAEKQPPQGKASLEASVATAVETRGI